SSASVKSTALSTYFHGSPAGGLAARDGGAAQRAGRCPRPRRSPSGGASAIAFAMVRADAIVVLGCRILPSGHPTAPAARRAAAAAGAYHRGVAPWIIASGGRRWGNHVEARVFRRELEKAGVPEGAVIEELCSLSTYENAIFSAAILRRLHATRSP